MIYKTSPCSLRRVSKEDIPLLWGWFKQPHVQEWWPTPERDEFLDHFLKRIRSKDTFAFIVLLDDVPFGYIQYYYIDRNNSKAGSWLPALPERTVGIDQFIGPEEYLGKGYGTLMIKNFIDHLSSVLEPNLSTIIVDPDPKNVRAIRCYEKVGFISVGVFAVESWFHVLMRYDV